MQELDLIGVVAQQMLKRVPEVAVTLFAETDHIGGHGDDAVLAQQLNGLLVFAGGCAFAYALQGGVAIALNAQQKADDAGFFVQMQDVGITHDVAGAGRAHQQYGHVFGNQRLQKNLPHAPGAGGQLIGKVDQLHAVLAVEAGDFLGKLHRVAVAPLGPEAALAAVAAKMRAAARELHDHGPLAAPVGVVGVIDQLPAHAVVVQPGDHWRISRGNGRARLPPGNAGNLLQITAINQRLHQRQRSLLAFAAHDEVNRCAVAQDLVP